VRLAGGSLEKGLRVCRYRAPSGVELAELSQRGHSTTGWKEGNS
jgi:hypothetical protein